MVTLRDGRLPAGVEHPLGLWFRDCRFLSAHELRICGQLPRLLTATDAAGTVAVHELTNPDLRARRAASALPAESAAAADRAARRRRRARCARRSAVRSYHRGPIRLPLEVRLGADFLPMLELRGIVPRHERPPPDARPGRLLARRARRGAARPRASTRRPSRASTTDGSLVFDLDLEPRGRDRPARSTSRCPSTRTASWPPRSRAAHAGRHARQLGRPALQPHPRALARRPRAAPLGARRPVLLRRRACPGSRRCSAATA